MVIELKPEQEARLAQLAQRNGRSLNDMLTEAAVFVAQHDLDHEARLERSIQQAERGEFIEEEEMDAWVATLGKA